MGVDGGRGMIGADSYIRELTPDRQTLHATQRYSQGWSDIDMWNGDLFIADVIVAVCRWKRSDKAKSFPTGMTLDEWHTVLKTIEDGFSWNWDEVTPSPEVWALLQTYFRNLWD